MFNIFKDTDKNEEVIIGIMKAYYLLWLIKSPEYDSFFKDLSIEGQEKFSEIMGCYDEAKSIAETCLVIMAKKNAGRRPLDEKEQAYLDNIIPVLNNTITLLENMFSVIDQAIYLKQGLQ
jgi:hypothetical protein